MKLYELLAAEYVNIFPSSREKADFIETLLKGKETAHILDIGCASGELAHQLTGRSRSITGIDLDSHMIDEAGKSLKSEEGGEIHFSRAEMRDYLSHSPDDVFDAVLCMGNTLVYLEGEEDLETFLHSVKKVLKEKGLMIIQILNYGNPSLGPGFRFPPAESERILFERAYENNAGNDKLDFKTLVRDKTTGAEHSETHSHYPFLSKRIGEIAALAGFSRIQIFGGYDREDAGRSDFFHIVVIEK